ncbi:hypothetical protein QBZ16_004469 [Prototheca wickerhamii]|uniref:Uncharacterized protein n=1 Tax=Prototheca wickerhamii TaxID=3111 RepID=A0AAD9IHE4_PROWI|nr:hypothetical protein QBZ16_004469 [Prototheca wickerhamii]
MGNAAECDASSILRRARALPHGEFAEAAAALSAALGEREGADGIARALSEYALAALEGSEAARAGASEHPLTHERAAALRGHLLAAALGCLATWVELSVTQRGPGDGAWAPPAGGDAAPALGTLGLAALREASAVRAPALRLGDAYDEILDPSRWRPALAAAAASVLSVSVLLDDEPRSARQEAADDPATEQTALARPAAAQPATLGAALSAGGLAEGLAWALRETDACCRVAALSALSSLLDWAGSADAGAPLFVELSRPGGDAERGLEPDERQGLIAAWVSAIPVRQADLAAAPEALESIAACLFAQTPSPVHGSQLGSLSQSRLLAEDPNLILPRLLSAGLLRRLAGLLLALCDGDWLDSVGIAGVDEGECEGTAGAGSTRTAVGESLEAASSDAPPSSLSSLAHLALVLLHGLLSHPGFGHCALEALGQDDAALRALVLCCSHAHAAFCGPGDEATRLEEQDGAPPAPPPFWAEELAAPDQGDVPSLCTAILTLLERCA